MTREAVRALVLVPAGVALITWAANSDSALLSLVAIVVACAALVACVDLMVTEAMDWAAKRRMPSDDHPALAQAWGPSFESYNGTKAGTEDWLRTRAAVHSDHVNRNYP